MHAQSPCIGLPYLESMSLATLQPLSSRDNCEAVTDGLYCEAFNVSLYGTSPFGIREFGNPAASRQS